jgi:DinB superfamily
MSRPEKNEYAEFYANYVASVEETDIVAALQNQITELQNLFAEISEEQGTFAYAEGKWTIQEVLGHLIDGERVFSYRALRISRRDQTPLAGFEENSYVANSNFRNRKIAGMLEELMLLRQSNVIFFNNLTETAWLQTGTASNAEISVRALAYIMVGHIRHHLNILETRYLN